MPFFSVIIPLYNKEDYIGDTLQDVLKQTFQDFEIIIVNDGSTDGSLEVVSRFTDSRIKLFQQKNQGVSVARNFGIEQAQSKYIALLDADDLWYNNHLEELKKLIETFPDAGLFCNNYEIYYTKNIVRPACFNFKYDQQCLIVDDFFKASITNCVAWTSSVGFSKEKFNSVGGFDIKLKTAQDIDLWIKLALKFDVAFNPKITMSYKLHVEDSLSKNEYNQIRYEFINKYSENERKNKSLNTYLDVNRYALAIRCILNNEIDLYQKVKKEIDFKNLNFKQRILLQLPKSLLLFIKLVQRFFIKKNIYLTAYN